jgi:hypothetical protein
VNSFDFSDFCLPFCVRRRAPLFLRCCQPQIWTYFEPEPFFRTELRFEAVQTPIEHSDWPKRMGLGSFGVYGGLFRAKKGYFQVNIGRVQVMTASDYAPPYWGEIWDFWVVN